MKKELTKTTFKSALDEACYLFGRAICLGALSLVCSSAPAQNLFVSPDAAGGNIYEFTPNGVRSTFASGVAGALAFDKAGNLFVSDRGNIYKITPNGVRSTFASELAGALAVDSAGNLFVTTGYRDDFGFPINGSGKIYKLTPNGLRTTFASGLDLPTGLAFDSAGNLFVANVSKFINGAIYKFTPAGVRSTFASGVSGSLAFQPTLTPTATLVNISTRGSVETGDNMLISGFIVSGSDSQQVIIRGLGPTLTSFGVPDALQDPVLELHNT